MNSRHAPHRVRGGFTLIEASLTTVIIGVAFVAMLQLFATGTAAQATGAELTSGLSIAKSIREMTMTMTYTSSTTPATWGLDAGENVATPGDWDDLNDLDNRVFDPPIDARGHGIPDMSGWKQTVNVESVDSNGLDTVLPDGSSRALRITTIVTHGSEEVCRLSWYAFDGTP